MKPARFEYVAPSSVEEAVGLLDEHGDDAKILAGGQSLVPMMNFRLVQPKYLVDINRLPGLSYIEEEAGLIRIGALTRQRAVERSPEIRKKNPLLLEGIQLVGHAAIRSRGTVGGSVIHADSTAELPTLLAVLEGAVRVTGPSGTRTIESEDLFLSYFTTTLESNEICEEVSFPVLAPGAGWAYEEFVHRHGDFALVGVATVLEADGEGRCTDARVALAGVGPIPERIHAAEQFLKGEKLTPIALEEAGRKVAEEVMPEGDMHATEEYRRHLAAVMTTRALRRALDRLQRGGRQG